MVAFLDQSGFCMVAMASAPVHPSMALIQPVGPTHPSEAGFVTPPQAGMERHTTPENIAKFFDPNTYRTKSGLAKPQPISNQSWERHTTPENIAKFFDPKTYCQKRPAPGGGLAGAPAAAKAKAMGRHDLVDKFKLAAQLNGIDWEELAVPRIYMYISFKKCLNIKPLKQSGSNLVFQS